MFTIHVTYVKPLEEVDRVLPEHAAFLKEQYRLGRFITSGRLVPRTGGVVIANYRGKKELLELLQDDPFCKQGIAEYSVLEFSTTMCDPRFQIFVDG